MHKCARLVVLSVMAISFQGLTTRIDAAVDPQRYDIVIAGAGTGGISAGIEAARLGARVVLLEESDWIGGQMAAAGVSTMDEGNDLTPPSGLYREFLTRMEIYYLARGKSVSTCYGGNNSHCFEPSAIRKILNQMIDEVNDAPQRKGHIDLLLRDRVVRVITEGNSVTGVVTAQGRTLLSKVLIDATEYGDVLPLTPARFRSGTSIGHDYTGSCVQDITYVMVIRKYPDGVPKELQMLHPPPEYNKYLPELHGEMQVDGNPNDRAIPVSFAEHNAYRGLPDSANPDSYVASQKQQITRTELNWFNDYPAATDIFDRDKRGRILCEAKLMTLAELYFIQHELKETQWSVANDEGYDTPFNRTENACPNIPEEFKAIENNLPPMPYIRESQRLVGEYTLTAADIRRERPGEISVTGFPDSIAVGDYADDLHGCEDPDDLERDLEHLSDQPPGFRSGPFEIPLRSLIPEKVDGLLAAEKNISQSRLANGATRLQPITMLTGQAAGALAALSVEQGVPPRAVSADRVEIALLKAGSILAREPMRDIPFGTRPWQAAQFAVVHQWMTTGKVGFVPTATVTRAEAAEILARVFGLAPPPQTRLWRAIEQLRKGPIRLESSYSDVPLYSPESSAVEAWRATGLLPACKQAPALFCPDTPLTIGEFIQSVAALNKKEAEAQVMNLDRLTMDVHGSENVPLTRIDAAVILYNGKQLQATVQ